MKKKLTAILLTVALVLALGLVPAASVFAADYTDYYYSDDATTEAAGYTTTNPSANPVNEASYEGSWISAVDLSNPVSPGWHPENSGPDDTLNSYWVSNDDGAEGSGTQGNKEDDQWRLFREEISVPASAINIEGRVWMAADNDVISYFNDKDTVIWEMDDVYGPAPGDPQPAYYDDWNGPYSFTPVAGINYLYFVVRNWGHTTEYPGNPTGLLYRVEVDYDLATLDDLTPDGAYNPVGTQHCVTVTVDPPDAGAVVSFMVTGANPTTPPDATDTTDGEGEAHFCYTGHSAGTDTIRAYFDEDFDGEWDDPEEPSLTVTKYWLEPFVTGGGKLNRGTVGETGKPKKAAYTFGGNVGLLGDTSVTIAGQFQIVDHTSNKAEAWHCHNEFYSLVFSGGPTDSPPAHWDEATFVGKFTSNRGSPDLILWIHILDDQEPGKGFDEIDVDIGTWESSTFTFDHHWFDGTLDGGNLQVHDLDD